jgi:excisionase family DNA binding protein
MSAADPLDDAPTDIWVRPDLPEPPAPAEPPALLRVEEVAALLRINRKSAYAAIEDGTIPGVVRIGRVIRVNRDAVIKWTCGQGGASRSRRTK